MKKKGKRKKTAGGRQPKARARSVRSSSKKRGASRKATRESAKKVSRKPAARGVKKAAAPSRPPTKKAAGRKGLPKPVASAPLAAGSRMFGEGNRKADEEYREGLQKFSRTHDAERLARQAALDLEADGEEELPGTAPRKAEEEPEW